MLRQLGTRAPAQFVASIGTLTSSPRCTEGERAALRALMDEAAAVSLRQHDPSRGLFGVGMVDQDW